MVATDILASLIGLLQDDSSDELQSAIEVITALAEFGGLIYYFVLCEG
jgi:hypothetical protein